MSAPPGPDRVAVGVVGKALGLRGEVYVRPDPDVEHDFAPGQEYPADPAALVVASSRLHSGRQVVQFEGVTDRDAADLLRGTILTVPRDDVDLDEDAYWSADLIGREVVDDAGDLVGVVEQTRDGFAHDYLVVARPDGGEVLVPAVEELVEVTDDRVVIHAIPGLLNDEDAW